MALSFPEYTEIQAMLKNSWSVRDIQKKMKEKGRPIGLNTLYDIKNGDMTVDKLPDTKINKYYNKGEGARMLAMRKRIEERVNEMTNEMIDDGLRRTAIIEQLADTEMIERLVDPEQVKQVGLRELVSAADSANKRNLLLQGKPTDIFKQMDDLTPQEILAITTYGETKSQGEGETGQLGPGGEEV